MTRTILIHLHVEAPDSETRDADEVADALGEALRRFNHDDPEGVLEGLTFAVPLAEELEVRA